MNENSNPGSSRNDRVAINDSLLDILFEALGDPLQPVRTGAIRLLVRLPLPNQAWYRLADIVEKELSMRLLPEIVAEAQLPFDELMEAAIRIPVSTVRRKMYECLGEEQVPATRQQVVWALARAGDRVATDFLWPSLKEAGEFNPVETASCLARFKLYEQSVELNYLAEKHADPLVRFWLSVAAVNLGDIKAFVLLVTRYLEGKLELPILYENPFVLAQEVAACGPFPDNFREFLLFIQSKGELAQVEGISQLKKIHKLLRKKEDRLQALLPMFQVLIDELAPSLPPTEPTTVQPAQPSTPWDGSLDELATNLIQNSEDGNEILLKLSPPQKTSLISAWFTALEKYTARDEQTGEIPFYSGIGNRIMGLPGWFWQDFDPDLAQLFDVYMLLAPERTDLMKQLAWVISRAGINRLINEYLPLLPGLESDDKVALLQLLVQAVILTAQAYGPTYGAGPDTTEIQPVIRHFIDFKSAAAGGEEAPLPPGEEKPVARFVQAAVYDNSNPAAQDRLQRAFLAGKEHLLKVWIGKLQAGYIAAPQPIDLSELPDLPSWDLQVYFWEPNHAPAMQIGHLTVYQKQLPDLPVSTCEFTFTPRADLLNFQGRLAVVYQKNVLQMLFLEGQVLADPNSATDGDQIRFQWAEVKGLRSPEQLQEFDLVFYNETDPVQGAGLIFFGGQAGLKRVNGLDQGIQDMISALKEAGAPGAVSLKAHTEALVILANQGSMLYQAILEQIGTDNQALLHLRDVKRLQLVSAVRDVLPLEMVYVYSPPNPDAKLCPNAQQAILTGVCTSCDMLDEENAANVICPAGFLGMRCVVERHVIQPLQQNEAVLEGKDYQLLVGITAGGKTINPFKSSLCGASTNVTSSNLKNLTSSIQTLFPDTFEYAENWPDWKEKIKKAPTLLILLPHTLKDRSIPSLEIGGTKLWQTAIKEAVVRASKDSRPVVLLIGCETAVSDVPYQGFAAAFSKNGAVITVVTLSPIHESHAVPITEILLKQFRLSAKTQQTFSEALLQARRTAMADGYAEALTLVADGDADWVLTEE